MLRRNCVLVFVWVLFGRGVSTRAAAAGPSEQNRSLTGTVTDHRGNPLKGAAVQIENSRDLAIASYITGNDGRYFFHQLSPDIDFTLRAKYKRWWSKPKLLNHLDSSKNPTINLEIPVE